MIIIRNESKQRILVESSISHIFYHGENNSNINSMEMIYKEYDREYYSAYDYINLILHYSDDNKFDTKDLVGHEFLMVFNLNETLEVSKFCKDMFKRNTSQQFAEDFYREDIFMCPLWKLNRISK